MRSSGVVLALALAAPAAASADRVEARILDAVDRRQPEALALLERAVNLNSGTLNFEGVRAVGALFQAEFDRIGFATRWVDGAAFGRAGHLVAERRGKGGGPHVLLIGHLDTVFETSSPFQRFERVGADRARGPGITDMKGGDVVIVGALAALGDAGLLDRLTVSVLLTGDEESAGAPIEAARAELFALADRADVALGFENAANDPATAVIARRGSTRWKLEVSARTGHSSQVFRSDVGAGAIFEVARVLEEFRTRLSGEPYLTFNPGLVVGGTVVEGGNGTGSAAGKSNVIAAAARVEGDLRTLTPEQLDSARARMREIASASLPHARSSLEFSDSYPPLAPSDGNRRLLALYDQVSRDLGHGPVTAVDPARAGAADISFTAGRVEMALDGLGMMGSGEHGVEETADLATLRLQMRRASVLLYRLAERGTAPASPSRR